MFPLTVDTDICSSPVLEHLSVLEDKMKQYFPSLNVNECNWVCNPFAFTTEDTKHLPLQEAEDLTELQADRTMKLKFTEETLLQFWILVKKRVPSVIRTCHVCITSVFNHISVRTGIFGTDQHQK